MTEHVQIAVAVVSGVVSIGVIVGAVILSTVRIETQHKLEIRKLEILEDAERREYERLPARCQHDQIDRA